MKKKSIKIKSLEKRLKQKNSYEQALGVVENFLKSHKNHSKTDSIKIYPYAEYPWQVFSELSSARWNGS